MHQLDRAAGAPSGFSGHTTKHKCECESLLHQKQRRPEGRPTTLAGPGSPVRYTPGEGTSRPTHYTQYTQMTNLLFRRIEVSVCKPVSLNPSVGSETLAFCRKIANAVCRRHHDRPETNSVYYHNHR